MSYNRQSPDEFVSGMQIFIKNPPKLEEGPVGLKFLSTIFDLNSTFRIPQSATFC